MKKIFSVFVILFCLSSCAAVSEYESYTFYSMDTFAEIRIYNETKDSDYVFASAEKVADDIEKNISKTIVDSSAYVLNSGDETSVISNETFSEILQISKEIKKVTDGAFEPMSGGLVNLWENCENSQRLPTKEEILTQVEAIGKTEIYSDQEHLYKNGLAEFDFGAVGKGYAADKMVQELKDNGVTVGMVTFVSTVSVFGERDFKIAIRTPDDSGDTAGYLTMRNSSLSVSGDYERFYTINGEKYNHIIDPHSGYPVSNGIHSVVVVCENAAVADALSTAVFVMGSENAMSLYSSGIIDFEMIIITDDHIRVTPGLRESFELVSANYELLEN